MEERGVSSAVRCERYIRPIRAGRGQDAIMGRSSAVEDDLLIART
jgi:hypothetical protein